MKKTITFLVALLTSTTILMAQTTFQKNFGGTTIGNISISHQTTDGGYILGGWSGNLPIDYFLVKTDSQSNIVWTKTYGTPNGAESLYDVIQTSDGGYMLAGDHGATFNSYRDMFFVKTDSNGDTLFTRTFGGYAGESATCIIQTADGGYLAAGQFSDNTGNTSVLLYKMNAAGDSSWTALLNSANESARAIGQTSDGGFIIGGSYNPNPYETDSYLIKTDNLGNVQWNNRYLILGNDHLLSVGQTSDGGYFMGGATIPVGGLNNKLFLIRTDAAGDTLWTSTYGGTGLDDGGETVQTSDGGFIQCGRTENFGANSNGDACLIKTNANGTIEWSKRYGGNGPEEFSSINETADHGFIAGGSCGSFGTGYLYTVKTDYLGNSNCSENATPALAYHPPVTVSTSTLISTLPSAWVDAPAITVGSLDTAIHSICISISGTIELENNSFSFSVYPSVVTNEFNVFIKEPENNSKIEIYNILGLPVYKQVTATQNNSINFSSYPNGLYLIKVITENKNTATQKLIKE